MKRKIDHYNDLIVRNIFYITLIFAFWIGVAVISIFYNIYLGSIQRTNIEDNTIQALRNHDRILGNDLKHDSIQQSLKDKLDSINNSIK